MSKYQDAADSFEIDIRFPRIIMINLKPRVLKKLETKSYMLFASVNLYMILAGQRNSPGLQHRGVLACPWA